MAAQHFQCEQAIPERLRSRWISIIILSEESGDQCYGLTEEEGEGKKDDGGGAAIHPAIADTVEKKTRYGEEI